MLRRQACVCTPGFLHRCFVCKPRPLKLCGNCSYPLNHLPRTEGKLLGNYYASINVLRVCSAVCVCVSMFMSVGVYMWMSKVRALCYVKILKLYHFLKHTFIVWIYVCMLVHMQREKENSGKLFFFFSFNRDGAQLPDLWQAPLLMSHLINPYHVVWDSVSHWDLGLSNSASLTCQWSPGGSTHLCLYSVGVMSTCCYCAWGFLWVLWINLGPSCSCDKHVIDWDISPPQTWTTLIVKIPCKMEAPFVW